MSDERKTYGTTPLDASISREDFERAVRYLHLSDLDTRDLLLRLAAQVVALTDEVNRRFDAPHRAVNPPSDPEASAVDAGDLGANVRAATPAVLDRIQASEARSLGRVWLETDLENKYGVEGASPPCEELMPICNARCCRMAFPLSTADLDEGVIRWDYGQPYMIRQRGSDGYCVHNDPSSHGCTVHPQRPGICRRYDCRGDTRIWSDYENRVLAKTLPKPGIDDVPPFDLMERVKLRTIGEMLELSSIRHSFPEDEPRVGPTATPRQPRTRR